MSEREEATVKVTWRGVDGYGNDETAALLNAQDTYRSTVLKEGPDDAAGEYDEREGAAVYIIRSLDQLVADAPYYLFFNVYQDLCEIGNIVVLVDGEKRLYISSEEFIDLVIGDEPDDDFEDIDNDFEDEPDDDFEDTYEDPVEEGESE